MPSEISFSGKNNAISLVNLMATWSLLDDKEQKAFRKELGQDASSASMELGAFFDYLRESIRKGGEVVRAGALVARIFPDTPPAEQRRAVNRLVRTLDERMQTYAVQRNLRENQSLRGRVMVKTYMEGLITQRFVEECAAFTQTLEDRPLSIMNVADRWWVSHQRYFHQATEQFLREASFFDEAFRWSEILFTLTQLRYFCEFFNRRRNGPQEATYELPSYLFQLCARYRDTFPLVALYEEMLQILQAPDAQKYRLIRFEEKFMREQPVLEKIDQLVLTKYAMNTWNYFLEKNDPNAAPSLFAWAKNGIDHGIFLYEKHLSDDEFLNLSLIAAAAGRFDYQRRFMDEHRDRMDPEYRDKAYQLARAYYHFLQGEHRQAGQILADHFPPGRQEAHKYNLRVKTLLIRCRLLQILEDWDGEPEFDKATENLKTFIGRHPELSEKLRAAYSNFIDVCTEIVAVKKILNDPNAESGPQLKAQLLDKLASPLTITCRNWLTEIAKALD